MFFLLRPCEEKRKEGFNGKDGWHSFSIMLLTWNELLEDDKEYIVCSSFCDRVQKEEKDLEKKKEEEERERKREEQQTPQPCCSLRTQGFPPEQFYLLADVVDDDKEEEEEEEQQQQQQQQQQDKELPTTKNAGLGEKNQISLKLYYHLEETKRSSSNIYATKIEQDGSRIY